MCGVLHAAQTQEPLQHAEDGNADGSEQLNQHLGRNIDPKREHGNHPLSMTNDRPSHRDLVKQQRGRIIEPRTGERQKPFSSNESELNGHV
jgi:hypothetical protein